MRCPCLLCSDARQSCALKYNHRQQCNATTYYPGQKNRYSRDIHEIDPQCDPVISRDIDFDLQVQRELVTRSCRGMPLDVEPKLDIA